MTTPSAAHEGPAGPERIVIVVGVPRSGTTVLNALLCTSDSANPLVGEASYLRLMLYPYRAATGLFEQHTRYLFDDQEAFRQYHSAIMAGVIDRYWRANGKPAVLVLKDPLLTGQLQVLHELVPTIEPVLIVRHPVDVIASRLLVQDRLGVERDPERLISEHNLMLGAVLSCWAERPVRVVTYAQLGQPGLSAIRRATGIDDLDPGQLWTRSRKPTDEPTAWQTPLTGAPINAQRRPTGLSPTLISRIEDTCLPLCLQILDRAGIKPGPYWAGSMVEDCDPDRNGRLPSIVAREMADDVPE